MTENKQIIRDVISEAVNMYVSTRGTTMITRSEVPAFSGKLISSNYMKQLDSIGEGCPSIRIGNKRLYNIYDFGNWLVERAS